ncbi:hypothetical protein RJ641_002267 [Dillenia turbinata]|uniref:Negative regulator of systemic acquired resistance SNI1 n=1 Tax=Dillenia turbinata TaxID=194707 RepID=A0AAN8ZG51_9MAGN
MEGPKSKRRRSIRNGIEENTMAILDSSAPNDSQDVTDDGIAFLEAVRSSSLLPEDGTPPSCKMRAEVFQILKDGKSIELIMASYQLLIELDKRFPRVCLTDVNKADSSMGEPLELAVSKEDWVPFAFGTGVGYADRDAADEKAGGPIDSQGFQNLVQDISNMANGRDSQAENIKFLGNMLLFQYLVNILEGDFLPRNKVYEGTMKWTLLRESLINMLLASRRINYKSLMKDCLSTLLALCHLPAGLRTDDLRSENDASIRQNECCNNAVAFALIEIGQDACLALQRLLVMVMELDNSRKTADTHGLITRADGVRTPLVEIIVDELTYDSDMLSKILQVFCDPRWKLDIALQYFSKYAAKPSVHTRRSNGSTDDKTFSGVLKCFSNNTSTKSITKKLNPVVAQLLLAHAFQASISVSLESCDEGISNSKDKAEGSSLMDICKNLISAFRSLRRTDEHMRILPLAREAIFTAATILSTK